VKIGIAAIQTPFIDGGAQYHIAELHAALRNAGHTVASISIPFRFWPIAQVRRAMDIWSSEDFTQLNGHELDRVICLQFPAYYVRHPAKVLWLMHQYRVAYELWDTPYAQDFRNEPGANVLRDYIHASDTELLGSIQTRYATSKNVARRLQRHNRLSASPLYHPPPNAEKFFSAPAEDYIFAPGRLEVAKRLDLLIGAIPYLKTAISVLITGDGGQRPQLEKLVKDLKVEGCVRFLGQIPNAEKIGLYAHCLSVYFAPFDEDLGYVTLEAMLSSKPVITCVDSGGPLEFVRHGETGLVVEPKPEAIAAAIEQLSTNRRTAARLGLEARERYDKFAMSWPNVVEQLLR
jgi:glycosyltransferase involved in cell wall biosynthesis